MRRPRSVGEAQGWRTVDRLARKFEYPDERTFPTAPAFGGGGGAPTIVVAASDASDFSKSKADFQCAGANDDETINAALAALHAQSVNGGRLLLTEGVFWCRYGQIAVMSTGGGRRVTIQGMAADRSTTLVFSGSSGNGITYAGGQGVVKDLAISDMGGASGAGIAMAAQDFGRIDNVRFDNSGIGLLLNRTTSTARNLQVARCAFVNVGIGVSFTGTGHTHVLIHHNTFRNTGSHAIQSTATAPLNQGLLIDNNVFNRFSGAASGDIINISGVYRDVSITNNHLLNAFGSGVVIDSELERGLIANNVMDVDGDGVMLAHAEQSVIARNQIEANRHGISLSDSSQIEVADNSLWLVGAAAPNTYDGVILAGTSNANYIHGNTVLVGPDPTRYGINISAATCNCNIVVGNSLGPIANYGTDAINDAGTDTQLFYPADATYGDNFTDCIATSPTSPSSPTSP